MSTKINSIKGSNVVFDNLLALVNRMGSQNCKAIFFCLIISTIAHTQPIQIGRNEMTKDLLFLKNQLHKRHPNLYVYSSVEEVDHWFRSSIAQLPDSISTTEAFILISSISPVLKDGHSYIYPGDYFLKSFFGDALLFPFDVVWLNDSLRIVRDLSDEQSLNVGDKILSINGIDVKSMRHFVVNHLSRDGRNIAYAEYLFTAFIQAWLGAFYNFPEFFNLDVVARANSSEPQKITVKGLHRFDIRNRRQTGDPYSEKGLRLYISNSTKSAIMTVQSFSNDIIRGEFHQRFKKELNCFFERMATDSIKTLYIDLRGNQGGELSNGIYLLKYIMQDPFKVVHSFGKIKVNKNSQRELIEFRNKWNGEFYPFRRNIFSGEIYLMVDAGSFSCSSIVANVIKKSGRGKIIGSESGGSSSVLAGGNLKKVKLPNCRVEISIPSTRYQLDETYETTQGGVKPDLELSLSIEELLMNDREKLMYIMKLCHERAD